jgi:Nif-specific regulatory protein
MNIEQLVGSSDALARLLRDVEAVARLDVSLMITGETGTGKSQLARVIHQNSARREGPFIELNCAALPENLLENELFGAAVGGHSGATTKVVGKVAAAEGGTLFLDEIAELPFGAQAKLLQLLQTKEYYPLGASRVCIANVRVIAATNADLAARIKDQTFREDLYYRLQVLPLRIPALRERRGDIQEIAQYFCNKAVQQHNLSSVTLSPAALTALTRHPWPGNVRQLENAIVAGTIRAASEDADQLEVRHLFPEDGNQPESRPTSFQEQTRKFQLRLLEQTLKESDWNIAATARALDLTRAHVYNLIKQFGLSRAK